jgi:hypothetical protein
MFEAYGEAIGGALLIAALACALALGWKATKSVERFREDHHESFLGRQRRTDANREPKS